jgi:phage tail-like protein
MTTVVASSDEQRPFVASRFVVEFGALKGVFTEVSGLSIDIEEVESTIVNEQGMQITRWTPGTVNYGELTLKREFTGDKGFWDWHMEMVRGDRRAGYRNGSITLYDLNSDPLDSWTIHRAWPSKWSASDLDSGSADPIIEDITIQLEYLQRGAS